MLSSNEVDQLLKQDEDDYARVLFWVKHIKFKGDLRLRYQFEEKDTTSSAITTTDERIRGRIRFRLGLKAKVDKKWKVCTAIATGSADPRSTNQTFQDNFSTKSIQLDYVQSQ